MKRFFKILVPVLLALLIVGSIFWYLFSYDRDFTRDILLSQARFQDLHGNSRLSGWFYDMAYDFSGQDENVAIELANQYKEDGNYTKAEYTLSNAIYEEATVELYIALCRTYVEQDKLLDAVSLLQNIADPDMKAQLDALRPGSPTADYAPGFYAQYISVNLQSEGGTLFCTTDGEYPSVADPAYSEPITLGAGETTIYAISVASNGLVSPLTIMGYTVGGVIEPAVFTDINMEAYIRTLLEIPEGDTVYTNDLWGITEFTLPETVETLEDLKLLSYVRSLTIQDHAIESLEPLAGLSKLETLDLTGSTFPMSALEALVSLPELKDLTLARCGLASIEALRGLTGLTRLDLGENTLRNLDPVMDMSELRELDLRHNAVTDLIALAALPYLEKLDVSHNALTTLEPLAACSRLAEIEAGTNQISALKGMDQLGMLQKLCLDYNRITDISPLSFCTEMVELRLSNNQLTNLEALRSMAKLDLLDFSYNNVETLPQWAESCTLRVIDGSYNQLAEIDSLAKLEHLSYVYMKYNAEIENIDALGNCYRLVQVDVYGTKVKNVDALTEHDIIVSYDPT